MTLSSEKRCPRCGEVKSINEFDKNRANSGGLASWCKSCKHKENVERRRQNRSKYREMDKKYHYQWIDKYPHRNWAIRSINRHREKFIVEIDLNWLEKKAKETSVCPLCGVDLYYGRGKGHDRTNTPTLDRLDNGNIITESNTAIICYKCNATKGNRSVVEFMAYCKAVIPKLEALMPYGNAPREKKSRGRVTERSKDGRLKKRSTSGLEGGDENPISNDLQ